MNMPELGKTKLEKLEQLKKALQPKDGQAASFTWKEADAKKFIDYVKDETGGLLKKIRMVDGSAPTKKIAKIIDGERFLKPAGAYTRDDAGHTFTTDGLLLESKEVHWKLYVSDNELEDNIEGQTLQDHLQQICARKIWNEFVEAIIYWRKVDNPSASRWILNVFNGVKFEALKKGNYLDATTLSSREVSRNLIVKGKKLVPPKFRRDLNLVVGSDIKIDIDELYNDPTKPGVTDEVLQKVAWMPIIETSIMTADNPRPDKSVSATTSSAVNVGATTIPVNTDLTSSLSAGDQIIVNAGEADEMVYTVSSVATNSITIIWGAIYPIAANTPINKAVNDAAEMIFTDPQNIIFYTQRDVRVEFERIAPSGYNIWYTMRIDIAVENPQALAVIDNVKAKTY